MAKVPSGEEILPKG